MKKKLALLALFFTALSLEPLKAGNEFLLRLGTSFGVLARVEDTLLHGAVRRHVVLNPEIDAEYQIAGPWFATASFAYIYFLGQDSNSGHMNIYVATGGIKIVSFEDMPLTGDFFDRTRWWLGLQGGMYRNQSRLNAIIPRGTETDFGMNVSGGFDTFFRDHWAAGIQTKLHYVPYDRDDYLFLSFGPHIVFRF